MNERQTKVMLGVENPGSGNISDDEKKVRKLASIEDNQEWI